MNKLVTPIAIFVVGFTAWVAGQNSGSAFRDTDPPQTPPATESESAAPILLADVRTASAPADDSDTDDTELPSLRRPGLRRGRGLRGGGGRGGFLRPPSLRPAHPGPSTEGPQGEPEPLSPEDIDSLMDLAEEHFPELHARLSRLREHSPQVFERMLNRARGPLMNIAEHLHGPDGPPGPPPLPMIRSEISIRRLAAEYRRAESDEKRAELKAAIRREIADQFEHHLRNHREMIEKVEKRLREAKEDLALMQENRESLIDARVASVLEGRFGPPGPGPLLRHRHGRGHDDIPPHHRPPPRQP